MLQSPKKSGFNSPTSDREAAAQMAEMSLESSRAVDEAGFKNTLASAIGLGIGNNTILKDMEGSVNQRNYPMVGKDQGALDYNRGSPSSVDGMNAVQVDVNALPYPIEGYNLLPEFIGEYDIETDTNKVLDLSVPSTVVPSIPMVVSPKRLSPSMPAASLSPPSPSPPLMPPSTPMMPPSTPMMPPSTPMMPPSTPMMPPSTPMMPPVPASTMLPGSPIVPSR